MNTETIGLDLDGLRQTIAANNWRADALEIFGDLIAEVERLRADNAALRGDLKAEVYEEQFIKLQNQIATARAELRNAKEYWEEGPLADVAWNNFIGAINNALEALK